MKNLGPAVLTACISFFCITGFAQLQKQTLPVNEPDYNKPKLFADLPDRIDIDLKNFVGLFELQPGQPTNVLVNSTVNFSGQVISKASGVNSISVVVRLTDRPGARLIFSKVIDENNSEKYLGRIISIKHSDCYEIVSENGQYYFKKKGIYDLMSE
jgi:hypothetical protein